MDYSGPTVTTITRAQRGTLQENLSRACRRGDLLPPRFPHRVATRPSGLTKRSTTTAANPCTRFHQCYEILLYSYKRDNVVQCNIEERTRKQRCS